jgi:hypothetical protein
MTKDILTENISVPLGGVPAAKIDIDAGYGNLTIDPLTSDDQILASGKLQYLEKQGLPIQTLVSDNDPVTLSLKAGKNRPSWLRLPWAACKSATEWQINLNPKVTSHLTAHSHGGNIKLNLAGMAVTNISADTGGGNIDVILPDTAANLNVTAKTGAGNVAINIPSGVAARIHATTGLGKTIVDPRFTKTDKDTYQLSDFDTATNKIEIEAKSGAGNVNINLGK